MSEVTFYRDEALPFLEGKHCTADDLAYHRHFHEEYSVGLIDAGHTNAWCDGEQIQVEAGRMISFPPMMLHACHPEPDVEWRYKMLFIRPDWLQKLGPGELNRLHIPFLLGGGKNETCRERFNHTMGALASGGSPLETETALIELVQALVDPNENDLGHAGSPGVQEQKYVKMIKDYLQANFTEQVTLEQLEQEAGISRFHLIRLFKKGSHLPPHAYQNLLRINHAKIQLAKQRPIVDIAAEVGYYDQSHFTKAFSKIVGATPRQYAMSI